jgi:hypothetical protein
MSKVILPLWGIQRLHNPQQEVLPLEFFPLQFAFLPLLENKSKIVDRQDSNYEIRLEFWQVTV